MSVPTVKKGYLRPLDFKRGHIDMNHGAGGRASQQLIDDLFAPAFDNPALRAGNDGAVLDIPPQHRLVVATDGHVISPLFFPGGDIGSLSVHGTINDVAMMGARPIGLTASFVLEEGFPLADLKRIVESMAKAAQEAGVPIVSGDTKVVERGHADGVFISTTGVGVLPATRHLSGHLAQPGDAIIVSGTIGDHGVTILSLRESLSFVTDIKSDSAALHDMVAGLLDHLPEGTVRTLRDPTRGGLGTTLNEIARQSGVGMVLDEQELPVNPQVEAACELLGLDVLYMANEGKLVAIVAAEYQEKALALLRAHPLGQRAACIGEVTEDKNYFVQMKTGFGGRRMVDWLSGEPLPRIC